MNVHFGTLKMHPRIDCDKAYLFNSIKEKTGREYTKWLMSKCEPVSSLKSDSSVLVFCVLFFFSSVFIFNVAHKNLFKLEDNFSAVLCWFLPYNMNQP